ncbi:MAG: AtpZ/AtpI family protein [Alphaproteobacteria bacterium]|nr:AtpZ/AtpI family protein [Alphaproteobacteria bacterium]MBF0129928.1 AtpZ/AtpI family protein [Alphaproteobacteria bacterium]
MERGGSGGGAASAGTASRLSGIGMAWRISIELVSALAVGTGIGWFLDGWLDTRPWFMVVFLFLGGAAGVMNVYRVVKGYDDSVGLGQAARRAKVGAEAGKARKDGQDGQERG